MKPKRIFLVRHGESEGNVDSSTYGRVPDPKISLTEQGMKQSNEAGQKLKDMIGDESIHFYISPYVRTKQTYEAFSQYFIQNNYTMYEDPRLREQERGHFYDEELDPVRDKYGVFYYRFPPSGESCADVYDRITIFIDNIHVDFEKESFSENAVIITHGMTIRVMLMRWFRWTVEQFENLENPENCKIIELVLNDDNLYDLKTPLSLRGRDSSA
jgi:broad specificity phosphatase PhoE